MFVCRNFAQAIDRITLCLASAYSLSAEVWTEIAIIILNGFYTSLLWRSVSWWRNYRSAKTKWCILDMYRVSVLLPVPLHYKLD